MKINELFERDSTNPIELVYIAYIEAALWADLPEGSDKDRNDVSSEMYSTALNDVKEFLHNAEEALSYAEEKTQLAADEFWGHVGHDLWLTRNGHGAGFWDDPDYYGGDKNADTLTNIAQSMGEKYLYVGDDGKVYTD